MVSTRMLIIITIMLLLIIYVQFYFKYNGEYTIIQSNLNKIDINTLYEKSPVVIYDAVKDPNTLLTTLFAYSYLCKNYNIVKPTTTYKNKAKFAILYNDKGDVFVNIVSPKYSVDITKPLKTQDTVQYITIKLKQNQILILPFQWYYECTTSSKVITLHDALTKCYNFLV